MSFCWSVTSPVVVGVPGSDELASFFCEGDKAVSKAPIKVDFPASTCPRTTKVRWFFPSLSPISETEDVAEERRLLLLVAGLMPLDLSGLLVEPELGGMGLVLRETGADQMLLIWIFPSLSLSSPAIDVAS